MVIDQINCLLLHYKTYLLLQYRTSIRKDCYSISSSSWQSLYNLLIVLPLWTISKPWFAITKSHNMTISNLDDFSQNHWLRRSGQMSHFLPRSDHSGTDQTLLCCVLQRYSPFSWSRLTWNLVTCEPVNPLPYAVCSHYSNQNFPVGPQLRLPQEFSVWSAKTRSSY